uniref:Uncharacterized protein n=1 Tax=Arundo donax TaxID=35708 RepID=A0A0A8Y0Q7_ARUDO
MEGHYAPKKRAPKGILFARGCAFRCLLYMGNVWRRVMEESLESLNTSLLRPFSQLVSSIL